MIKIPLRPRWRAVVIAMGFAATAVVTAIGLLAFTDARYSAIGRWVNGYPDAGDAEQVCRSYVTESRTDEITNVRSAADHETWTVTGTIGGEKPGRWTCTLAFSSSGATLDLMSLELPGEPPRGIEHQSR